MKTLLHPLTPSQRDACAAAQVKVLVIFYMRSDQSSSSAPPPPRAHPTRRTSITSNWYSHRCSGLAMRPSLVSIDLQACARAAISANSCVTRARARAPSTESYPLNENSFRRPPIGDISCRPTHRAILRRRGATTRTAAHCTMCMYESAIIPTPF